MPLQAVSGEECLLPKKNSSGLDQVDFSKGAGAGAGAWPAPLAAFLGFSLAALIMVPAAAWLETWGPLGGGRNDRSQSPGLTRTRKSGV